MKKFIFTLIDKKVKKSPYLIEIYTSILSLKKNMKNKAYIILGVIIILLGFLAPLIKIFQGIMYGLNEMTWMCVPAGFIFGLPLVCRGISNIEKRKNSVKDRKKILSRTFPYFCDNCQNLVDIFSDICEQCGAKSRIRKATREDYERYSNRK